MLNSPGLVVMGGDSSSRGRGFKSLRHILDGHEFFSNWFAIKMFVCLKRPKINKKEAGVGPFKKIANTQHTVWWVRMDDINRKFILVNSRDGQHAFQWNDQLDKVIESEFYCLKIFALFLAQKKFALDLLEYSTINLQFWFSDIRCT